MSQKYSASRAVAQARAKQRARELWTVVVESHKTLSWLVNPNGETRIPQHEQITQLFRKGLCAAQELENIAKGTPSPEPGL